MVQKGVRVVSLINPRRRHRPRGHPTVAKSIRLAKELVPVTEAAGSGFNDGLERMVDIANDATTELGEDWIEVELYAHRQGTTEGAALGRLAKERVAQLREEQRKAPPKKKG